MASNRAPRQPLRDFRCAHIPPKSRFVIVGFAGWQVFMGLCLCLSYSLLPRPLSAMPILNTLGTATPGTHFDVPGSFGQAIFAQQFTGPLFTLAEKTTLSSIGAFVNCSTVVVGQFQCPDFQPIGVQIRPSVNGTPDPLTVLASFTLSDDMNPTIISFESVAINLPLSAGTYFALFTSPDPMGGLLLAGASAPVNYQAESVVLGFLNPTTGTSGAGLLSAAVEISAVPEAVPEPTTLLLFGTTAAGLALARWRQRRRQRQA